MKTDLLSNEDPQKPSSERQGEGEEQESEVMKKYRSKRLRGSHFGEKGVSGEWRRRGAETGS